MGWRCIYCDAQVDGDVGHECAERREREARMSTAAQRFSEGRGRKDDGGKAPWHLFTWRAAAAVVRVLEFGAAKYGPGNWRLVDDQRNRYFSAALRHLTAWWCGEKRDPDTGESHLAHAACCVLFLLETEEDVK